MLLFFFFILLPFTVNKRFSYLHSYALKSTTSDGRQRQCRIKRL